MNNSKNSRGLLNALQQLLPGSTLSVIHEYQWYSLTFVGTQVCISVLLSAQHDADFANRFAQELPDFEFNLSGQLVADISVTLEKTCDDTNRLVIDVLLLED